MATYPPQPFAVRPGPLDLVSPAFARTNALLTRRPFKLWRSWKLAAMSYLALLGSFFAPWPLLVPVAFALAPHSATDALPPYALGIFAVVIVAYSLFYLGLFYLGTRVELVQFEMIVTMADRIGPMWNRQGARVWPWLGAKAAIGTALTALLAPLLLVVGYRLIAIFPQFVDSSRPTPDMVNAFMGAFFGAYAVLIGLAAIFLLIATLLHDFALPFYEIEGLTVGGAMARGWKVIVAEPLQVVLYLLVKGFLGFLGYAAAGIVGQIVAVPIVLVAFAGALGIGLMSRHGHTEAPSVLLIVLGVLVLVLLYALLIFVLIGVYGYVMTLLDSYALYFVGTRYPALGDLMNPPPGVPPTFTPPPPQPSPEEEDDGGPTLPMDPALA